MQSGNMNKTSSTKMNATELLSHVKLFAASIKGMDEEDIESIEDAKSVGAISCLLFSRGLFTHYYQLSDHLGDLSPTAEEMNQQRESDNTNPWYWLLSNERTTPILLTLFEKDIFPDHITASKCYGNNNKTLYTMIMEKERFIDPAVFTRIVETLHHIMSKHRLNEMKMILANVNEIDEENRQNILQAKSVSEIWCILFYNQLFDANYALKISGIDPTSDEMNQEVKDYINPWHCLARSKKGSEKFLALLMSGMSPDAKILSEVDADNQNTWYLLTYYNEGIHSFSLFIEKNILPSIQDLSLVSIKKHRSTWLELASFENGQALLLSIFINTYILPTTHDLSVIDKKINSNGWMMLSHREKGQEYIEMLLSQGVHPCQGDFSIRNIYSGKNIWNYLSETRVGLSIIHQLISKKLIIPRACDLKGTWNIILNENSVDKFGIKIVTLLFDHFIFPTSKDMAAVDKITGNDGWHALTMHIDLLLILLNHGIYPDYKSLTRYRNKMGLKELTFMDILKKKYGGTLQYEEIKQKIDFYISSIIKIKYNYNIDSDTMVGSLLALEDDKKSARLNFLYFFYLYKDTYLNFDILTLIGQYILPMAESNELSQMQLSHATCKALLSNRNIRAFSKYNSIKSLDSYCNSKFSIFRSEKERANSLKDGIKTSSRPDQVLLEQYWMSNTPGISYPNNNPIRKHHQKPYFFKLGMFRDELAGILNENYHLLSGKVCQPLPKSNKWHFSYPKNENDEIMTPGLDKWQAGLTMTATNIQYSYDSYCDFRRLVFLDGMKGTACNLISRYTLPEFIKNTNTACIIRTINPDKLYLVTRANKNMLHEIKLSDIKLQMFDSKLKPAPNMKKLSNDELNSISDISKELEEKIISDNIKLLCQKLTHSVEKKKLFEAWLGKFGGQAINGFFDASLFEGHFGESEKMTLLTSGEFSQNWVVKNNKLTCIYTANINSIQSGTTVFFKEKNHLLIQSADFNYISDNNKNLSPLMTINAEIVLMIEVNHDWKSIVIPKLDKYEVTCHESLTGSGKLLFQSPVNNKDLMLQLTQSNRNNGGISKVKGFVT